MWNSFRSIRTVPRGPSGCAKRAPGAQNILSAVRVNSTCKIKIKVPLPEDGIQAVLNSFRSIHTVPHGPSDCANSESSKHTIVNRYSQSGTLVTTGIFNTNLL